MSVTGFLKRSACAIFSTTVGLVSFILFTVGIIVASVSITVGIVYVFSILPIMIQYAIVALIGLGLLYCVIGVSHDIGKDIVAQYDLCLFKKSDSGKQEV